MEGFGVMPVCLKGESSPLNLNWYIPGRINSGTAPFNHVTMLLISFMQNNFLVRLEYTFAHLCIDTHEF